MARKILGFSPLWPISSIASVFPSEGNHLIPWGYALDRGSLIYLPCSPKFFVQIGGSPLLGQNRLFAAVPSRDTSSADPAAALGKVKSDGCELGENRTYWKKKRNHL